MVPREVSGDRAEAGDGERYISVIGGNLSGPASGLIEGSLRSASLGERSG